MEQQELAQAMDTLVEQHTKVSFDVLKTELKNAYARKHSTGKVRPSSSAYIKFVKETLPIIRENFPSLPRNEQFSMVLSHWKVHSKVHKQSVE